MHCLKDGKNLMQILLANPRGFCAGVDRAIDIVERAVTLFGAPIYVRHEVVHNKYVVDRLRTIGAVFVEELNEVPDNATVIFSAHGVPRVVQQEAKRRSLNVFDATCPLVTKVHMEITPCTKTSGAEAPAVTPTVLTPSNHSRRRSSGPSTR